MDCGEIKFSAEKSRQRIEKAAQVFPMAILSRILILALYLLGARRSAIATQMKMPDNSVKTHLRVLLRDGFSALRDRRCSLDKAETVSSQPAQPTLQVSIRNEDTNCIFDFGEQGKVLEVAQEHQVHIKTLLLSFYLADIISARIGASTLGMSQSHFIELSKKLSTGDVGDTLIDKRQGQKKDFLVGPAEKAEIIKHFAARAVTGHSTASNELAKAINEEIKVKISPRTIRWHMNKLGLALIKKSLPELTEALKKNC